MSNMNNGLIASLGKPLIKDIKKGRKFFLLSKSYKERFDRVEVISEVRNKWFTVKSDFTGSEFEILRGQNGLWRMRYKNSTMSRIVLCDFFCDNPDLSHGFIYDDIQTNDGLIVNYFLPRIKEYLRSEKISFKKIIIMSSKKDVPDTDESELPETPEPEEPEIQAVDEDDDWKTVLRKLCMEYGRKNVIAEINKIS